MANEIPAELHALIDAHIESFNARDLDRFRRVFGRDAVIVDGIAPYLWLGPEAPAHWWADVKKWRVTNGVVGERISYEASFWNVEGSYAYAVVSGTLTVVLKEGPTIRTGTLAYTFAVQEGAWRIQAQAWGRTS